jgi:small subunit ribosomal protein S7
MEKIFIGMLTKNGHRAKAQKIFFTVAARVSRAHNLPFSIILHRVFELLEPVLNYSVLRRGSTNYVSPRRMSPWKAKSLVVRWLLQSAKLRSEPGIIMQLEGEFNDLLAGKGQALKWKLESQRRAVSNRFVLRNIHKWKLWSTHLRSAAHLDNWASKFVKLVVFVLLVTGLIWV